MNYRSLSELCEYANDKISVGALSQKITFQRKICSQIVEGYVKLNHYHQH